MLREAEMPMNIVPLLEFSQYSITGLSFAAANSNRQAHDRNDHEGYELELSYCRNDIC